MGKKKGKYSDDPTPSGGIESYPFRYIGNGKTLSVTPFSDMEFLTGGRFYEGDGDCGGRDFRFGRGYQKKIRFNRE